MGSGGSSSYNNGGSGSQPYAPTYHVVKTAMDRDKMDSDIYNPQTGYFHNPTASTLEKAIDGNRVIIDGKRPDGPITYILNQNDDIVIARRCNPNNGSKRSPHPTLIGGKNPEVQCAGMINFSKGKIVSVNNDSGHFRPNAKSMDKVYDALKKVYNQNPEIFDKRFKWR